MVTVGTYQKQPLFRTARRLTFLCEQLMGLAQQYSWKLEAWAVFPNHYHFIGTTEGQAATLRGFLSHLHTVTAKAINIEDEAAGRRVWFQYWDSHVTYERSYLARLNFVHRNAVHHRLVREPERYSWCSAGWFERSAGRAFFRTVMRMRSESVKVVDDFVVDPADVC